MGVIPKSTSHKYVLDISKDYKQSIRYEEEAKNFFVCSVEEHIIQVCEIACKIAKHCKRKTVQKRDVELALTIIGENNKNIIEPSIPLKPASIRRLAKKAHCQRLSKDIHVPLIQTASKYIKNIVKTLYTLYPDIKTVTTAKLEKAQKLVDTWHRLEKGNDDDDIDSDDEPLLDWADKIKSDPRFVAKLKQLQKAQQKKSKKKPAAQALLMKLATQKKSNIRPTKQKTK